MKSRRLFTLLFGSQPATRRWLSCYLLLPAGILATFGLVMGPERGAVTPTEICYWGLQILVRSQLLTAATILGLATFGRAGSQVQPRALRALIRAGTITTGITLLVSVRLHGSLADVFAELLLVGISRGLLAFTEHVVAHPMSTLPGVGVAPGLYADEAHWRRVLAIGSRPTPDWMLELRRELDADDPKLPA